VVFRWHSGGICPERFVRGNFSEGVIFHRGNVHEFSKFPAKMFTGFVRESFLEDFWKCLADIVWVGVQITMQDYKSQCAAVMIYASRVNTQTDSF